MPLSAIDPGVVAAAPGSERLLLPGRQAVVSRSSSTAIAPAQFDLRRCQLGETPTRPHAGSARLQLDDDAELRDPAIDRAFVTLTEVLRGADNDYARMLAV